MTQRLILDVRTLKVSRMTVASKTQDFGNLKVDTLVRDFNDVTDNLLQDQRWEKEPEEEARDHLRDEVRTSRGGRLRGEHASRSQ